MRSLATGIILAVSVVSGGGIILFSLEYPVTQSVSGWVLPFLAY